MLDHFSFSADGRWLVANIEENGKTDIHVADLKATPLTEPNFVFTPVTTDGKSAWPTF
jgi:hypothetical protein